MELFWNLLLLFWRDLLRLIIELRFLILGFCGNFCLLHVMNFFYLINIDIFNNNFIMFSRFSLIFWDRFYGFRFLFFYFGFWGFGSLHLHWFIFILYLFSLWYTFQGLSLLFYCLFRRSFRNFWWILFFCFYLSNKIII